MSAIRVSELTKDYDGVRANDEVSFEVAEGEIFGYLGPNGAGKTTTIRTLMGFQSPTSGTATLLDADIRDEEAMVAAKERVGYLPSTPGFDETATGTEILDLHASLKGDSRRRELLEMFDVPVERAIRGYSTGQKQKLGLVQAFMHEPDLVVMDEPTSGLDPLVQQRFNEFVREEKQSGTTIFLSSHVLSEVRRVCDRIGIIRDGRMVTVENVEDLLHRSGKFVRVRVAADVSRETVALDGIHDLSVRTLDESYTETTVAAGTGATVDTATELTFTYTGDFDSLVDFVDDYHILELDVEEAPLEQVFMQFYGSESEPNAVSGGEA
ncbi:ABC transporter ATP-binding protein [Salinibaculum rarum]|uniref:ABC transporter ATP-binding protein n=1 Tax=Salinibaculum rarum TaxID=3058903 RepID=UPI00265ED60A|nr:ABC transporter ATP-binding protein [Salinibaculum sp. KK48]